MGTLPISLNDLLKAVTLLQPEDNFSRAVIAELLGFKVGFQNIKDEITYPQVSNPIVDITPIEINKNISDQKIEIINTSGKYETLNSLPEQIIQNNLPENFKKTDEQILSTQKEQFPSLVPSEIEFISQTSVPANISIIASIPKPSTSASEANSKLAFEALLDKNSSKTIILTILATISREGDIDFDRIVEVLSQNRCIDILPRQNLSTLRRGVQILVDVGEAMIPYRRDQVIMQSEIRRIVGDDNSTVFRFVGTPLKGVKTGFQLKPSNYEIPRSGMPVLLLTDLGIGQPPFSGDPATTDDWIDFINLMDRNRCPLIALVPYKKERWPDDLQSLMNIIYWDRCTKLLEVRKKIGNGHVISK